MDLRDPVARIMSVPVYSVSSDRPVSAVRRLMKEHGFHHVPVVDGGVLVGMISASDLLHLGFGDFGVDRRYLETYVDARYPLRELMTRELTTVASTASILEAAEILASGRFHALPVVDGERRLKGLVTSTDLLRYIVHLGASGAFS